MQRRGIIDFYAPASCDTNTSARLGVICAATEPGKNIASAISNFTADALLNDLKDTLVLRDHRLEAWIGSERRESGQAGNGRILGRSIK